MEREEMKRKDISTKIVLTACKAFHSGFDDRAPWRIIMAETGAPEKVVDAAMERESKKEHIEWGVSLRTAWLTEKGEKWLEEHEKERDK